MYGRKWIYRRILVIIFLAGLLLTCIYSGNYIDKEIPDHINIINGEDLKLNTKIPLSYDIKDDNVEAALTNNKSIKGYQNKSFTIKTKLFGIIPAKDIKVDVIEETKLIPAGFQVGIYLHTEGVMVIGIGKIKGMDGIEYNPAENIVKPDDYIVALNDKEISTKSQLIFLINKYGNNDIILDIRREGKIIKVKLNPVQTAVNEYKLGIWVRDDTQGIGTLTYLTTEGEFGSLGHGISDIDTGALLSSKNGKLYKADIWGIKRGQSGKPGGLLGSIEYEEENELGEITSNTNHGIFGKANKELIKECCIEAIPIGLKQEVKKGNAQIRCQINNKIDYYDIEIEEVDYANNKKNKGMVIQVTDTRLLSATNGIVQGMSGSPIIQNGKIIGAVTHVFVNNPTKGYGIFIENMLEQ